MNLVPDSPRQRHRHRVLFVVVAALLALASQIVQPSEPAAAEANDESAFVTALNHVRADNGLAPFVVNAELAALARAHSRTMADAGEIFHANPISAGFDGEWAKLGENVGVGASVEVLIDAFVASPGHFANIVDPSFTEIGVGVVRKDAAMYTTHRFLQVPGSAVTTSTAPPTSNPTSTTPTSTPPTPTTPAPPVTTSPDQNPPPSTAPVPAPAPLPAPPITAERVLALFALLDQVGT